MANIVNRISDKPDYSEHTKSYYIFKYLLEIAASDRIHELVSFEIHRVPALLNFEHVDNIRYIDCLDEIRTYLLNGDFALHIGTHYTLRLGTKRSIIQNIKNETEIPIKNEIIEKLSTIWEYVSNNGLISGLLVAIILFLLAYIGLK